MSDENVSAVSAEEFVALVRAQNDSFEFPFTVVSLRPGEAVIRLAFRDAFLRAGGTISGPTLFTLADLTLYAAVMSLVGPRPLLVTTDMTLHFLRRPTPGDLVARATIVKPGSKLVVGTVAIGAADDGPAVCHATGTYAVPSGRRAAP